MGKLFSEPTRWNIFARELEDILATRGLRLGQLDDRHVVYHTEKVRRLQQSLKSPRHLSTLNPEEMERLTASLQLTDIEQKRLRAALLATAVEMILLDRIDPEMALMASNDVFTVLYAAMKAQPEMVMSVGIKAASITSDDDAAGDARYTEALDLIDRATLALHMSQQATSFQAQAAFALQASDSFSRSLQLLEHSQSPDHASDTWRFWFEEAVHGQEIAAMLMHLPHEEAL